MSPSNRLAYLAMHDMAAQPRKGLAGAMTVVLTVFFFLFAMPVISSTAGMDELHAATRNRHQKHPAKQKLVQKAARQKAARVSKPITRTTRHTPSGPSDPDFISSESHDELITTTELMIENLIKQMNREDELRQQSNDPNQKSIVAALPSIRPVEGQVSSPFGMREHPILHRVIFHTGTDFSAPVGTRVVATADGTISFSGFDKGYGKKVVIEHGNGYQTVYAHLSKAVVRQGQHVRRGDVIAFSGNTGLSTGPHLHYEVRKDNVVVNPEPYLPERLPSSSVMSKHDVETVTDDNNS